MMAKYTQGVPINMELSNDFYIVFVPLFPCLLGHPAVHERWLIVFFIVNQKICKALLTRMYHYQDLKCRLQIQVQIYNIYIIWHI